MVNDPVTSPVNVTVRAVCHALAVADCKFKTFVVLATVNGAVPVACVLSNFKAFTYPPTLAFSNTASPPAVSFNAPVEVLLLPVAFDNVIALVELAPLVVTVSKVLVTAKSMLSEGIVVPVTEVIVNIPPDPLTDPTVIVALLAGFNPPGKLVP